MRTSDSPRPALLALTAALVACLVGTVVAVVGVVGVAPAHAALPSKATWTRDVSEAMTGSHRYLERRAAASTRGTRLAINLDIDNTALASHYDSGQATVRVLRFARKARSLGIAVLFNTARAQSDTARTARNLARAGYVVDGICGRRSGEKVVESKQRCRHDFVVAGYTIVANVGNRSTDLVGGDYERAYRLPSYGDQLS
ncbi:acid phosphatase [Nocardioides sp. HDW12B]|uniref:HAD family acid phosphatase n=1 Tax=Nocardioides sp. HDW12B TaxID=2714939 RepID=UPI0014096473|nr:HAD family acid phosphatase [Nocardioides sp. HDW12B]QIK68116.1 acid phosphatase [Nocardioides sp. HDW12B]